MVAGAHGITGARVIRLVEEEVSSDTEVAIALGRSIMASRVLDKEKCPNPVIHTRVRPVCTIFSQMTR